MTKEMHNIAVKTQQETVSMRILTLVALAFLPGTFFSVSCGDRKANAYANLLPGYYEYPHHR